jgi:hypothetical protein
MGKKVILKINKEEIPLNSFVQEFICSTILGMVSSLKKKEEDIKSLEIRIEFENEA